MPRRRVKYTMLVTADVSVHISLAEPEARLHESIVHKRDQVPGLT